MDRCMLFVTFVLAIWSGVSAAVGDNPLKLASVAASGDCVTCHQKRDPKLVAAWKKSRHGVKASCEDCHGVNHQEANATARKSAVCIKCHSGPARATYARSKHGVIAKLEARQWDWSKPLSRGNYRAPTCSYCHMYENNHDPVIYQDEDVWPACMGCHSPRFVQTLSSTNQQMLKIGLLKQSEAKQLITKYKAMSSKQANDLQVSLKSMEKHLQYLRLGIGHHSPDDQWWHGHPALDGDLIDIKGLISRMLREQQLNSLKQ